MKSQKLIYACVDWCLYLIGDMYYCLSNYGHMNMTPQNDYKNLVTNCYHCKSQSIIRSGFDRGVQRFKCKKCYKTFKATVGTPIHGLHKKEKVNKYLIALKNGKSVRASARYAGISKNTSFAWRHKLLSSLTDTEVLKNHSKVASVKIIKHKYSSKGKKRVPGAAADDVKTIVILQGGQLQLCKLKPSRQPSQIADKLRQSVQAEFIVASSQRLLTLSVRRVPGKLPVLRKSIKNGMLSKIASNIESLENWMKRFKGVASKYLQQYWNWYSTLFNLKQQANKETIFYEYCVSERNRDLYVKLRYD